jgi:flagellar protein FliO/FliZ
MAEAAAQEPVQAIQFIKMIIGLIFVIGVIAVMAWMYRRFGNLAAIRNNSILVESILTLGNREKLIIVRADKQRLLLGVTTTQIKKLAELDPDVGSELPDNDSKLNKNANSFAGILKSIPKAGKQ